MGDRGEEQSGHEPTLDAGPARSGTVSMTAAAPAGSVASADTQASGPSAPGSGRFPVAASGLTQVAAGTYVVLDEFARGGLGRIVRARDERTGRIVAIKEMLRSSTDAAARFVREALVTANLQHPGIVPVYEVGRWPDGQPFYAMKLVKGRPLHEVVAGTSDLDGRLGLIAHVIAVAEALAYAHGERVIHRDLKPHNVLCGAHGETVVIDWGLARRLDEQDARALPRIGDAAPGETVVGAVMGTPGYMAPEQARGDKVDERVDVYAIGAMLYHVLSGRSPYTGRTADELLERVRNEAPLAISEAAPGVPPDLAAIVERAMAREAAGRYPSAAELAADLRRFTTGQLVAAHHYTTAERTRRFVARNRLPLGIATAALATLAIGGTIAVRDVIASRRVADARRVEAQDRLTAAYGDRARVELEAGHADRALALTVAATELGAQGVAPRYIAARALEWLPAARRRLGPLAGGMAFVPGSHDLVVTTDTGVERWSAENAAAVWRTPGEASDLIVLDASVVAVAREDAVALLDLASGREVARIEAHPGAKFLGLLGASASRRWLAAPTTDGFFDVLDARTRARVAKIPFPGADRAPLVSEDGQRLVVTAKVPGTRLQSRVVLLERTGRVLELCGDCFLSTAYADGVVVSPMQRGGRATRLRLHDWTGRLVRELTSAGNADAQHLEVDAARGLLVVGFLDGGIELYELATGARRWRAMRPGRPFQILFDRAGRLWSVGDFGGLAVHDPASGLELAHFQPGGLLEVLSSDEGRVAVLDPGAGLATWPVAELPTLAIAPTAARVRKVVFTASGDVISGSEDGTLARFDLRGNMRTLGKHGARVVSLQILADGMLLSAGRDDVAIVRDPESGRELQRLIGTGYHAVASPDGRWIATGGDPGTVTIWSRATGERVRTLGPLRAPVMRLRWSPDGHRLAAIDDTGGVAVWHRDGAPVRELPASLNGTNVVFSPDGRWLVRCARDARNELTSLDGDKDLALEGGAGKDMRVDADFTPDGKRVVIAGTGVARVWETTGKLVATMDARGQLLGARFSKGGRFVYTGGVDQKLRVWDAETGVPYGAFAAAGDVYGLELDAAGERIAVTTLGAAFVRRVSLHPDSPTAAGTSSRCRSGLEVRDGVLREVPFDASVCNR